MLKVSRAGILILSISMAVSLTGCGMSGGQMNSGTVENMSVMDAGVSETESVTIPLKSEDMETDFDSSHDYYEYYLTEEELITDIEQGYIFRMDSTFQKSSHGSQGNVYTAPYVTQGNWSFHVHEENTVNLEIAFSDLLTKSNKNIFPGEERIIVEVISPDGQSVYRFEKTGDEITKDISIQEQIPVKPGEWTLVVSFAYVCGEIPAHLRIAAAYETPSEEDISWLRKERLNHGEDL